MRYSTMLVGVPGDTAYNSTNMPKSPSNKNPSWVVGPSGIFILHFPIQIEEVRLFMRYGRSNPIFFGWELAWRETIQERDFSWSYRGYRVSSWLLLGCSCAGASRVSFNSSNESDGIIVGIFLLSVGLFFVLLYYMYINSVVLVCVRDVSFPFFRVFLDGSWTTRWPNLYFFCHQS